MSTTEEFLTKVSMEGMSYALENYYDKIEDDEELDHLCWLADKELSNLRSYIDQTYGDIYDC